ncbi:MAG: TonB-dependent receptor [Prevotellaceae bacterium]|jgi:outer membrane receptor for ferrienterochelin and colicins|nr:TonB-dependent receptor [Prevotellaceae bacterium]
MFKFMIQSCLLIALQSSALFAQDKKTKETESAIDSISIIENVEQLDEIVVTGQFAPRSLKASVYKINVIGSEKIERKASSDIQSLLNTELGIRMSNDMALGETRFELMGMSGNNIKVLMDGVPIIERGDNKQSLSQIDINTVERIEIVEGPMSVAYGSDALAGVINIITKKPARSSEKNLYEIGIKLREESAGSEYGIFGEDKGVHRENVSGNWAHKGGFSAAAGINRNVSGGWTGDKTGRERQWQPKKQYLTNSALGYMNNKLNLALRFDYVDETIFTPINPLIGNPNEIVDRNFESSRITGQLQADWKLNSNISLNLASSYQNLERRTKTVITNTNTGEKWLSLEESSQDISSNRTVFLRTTAIFKPFKTLSFQPGAEYQRDEAGGDRIKGKPEISDVSFFVSAEYNPFGWMNIRPGVRSIFNSVYKSPPFIPALNTKFALNRDLDLRLSYARGFRAPTLRELYFSFHNANHNIDGNTDLKAEYSENFTGSFVWRIINNENIRLTSTLSGFYNHFKDRITIVPDENDPTHNIYDNLSRYKTTGGTLENALMLGKFQATINYSHIGRYNAYVEDESYSDRDLEQFRFSPEISSSLSYFWEKTRINFSLFYKYTGARKEYATNSNNELTLMGYEAFHWADFTIDKKFGKYLRLEGGIKNLFNITTITNSAGGGHGSTGTSVFIGCGRSFFLGLQVKINN